MAGYANDRQEPAVTEGVSLDTRNPSIVAILHCEPDRVLWPDGTQKFLAACAGQNAHARAPPKLFRVP